MNKTYLRRTLGLCVAFTFAALVLVVSPFHSSALNINSYSDLITDSAPLAPSNHTFDFFIKTNIAPHGVITIEPPEGFEIPAIGPTFDIRDVELYVNGVPRVAGASLTAAVDQVDITPGTPGLITYTLNTSVGITSGSRVEIRIGNHTSQAHKISYAYSTSTGTTTVPGDTKPIINGPVIGTQQFKMDISGGDAPAYALFSVAITNPIGVGPVNTREKVPPYRFNGAPTGEIGGTTLNVEISLETDEFSICKYSTASGTPFLAMSHRFSSTNMIVHSTIVRIATGTLNTYYVRCIDDEGNFNIDDYIIAFISQPPPSGIPNADGNVEGDGTGSGNAGPGKGTAGGSSSGSANGSGGASGSSSGGGGGSSGGGSGGVGPSGTSPAGGGLEASNGPYQSGDAEVVIQGYSFPGSTVYALVDGFQAKNTKAASDGSYSLTISAIAHGVYTFGVYAISSDNQKSSTFSTSFTVTGGRTSNLSNINMMPTVSVTPNPVTSGQPLTVNGRAIPNSEITIENQNSKNASTKKSYTANSNAQGIWTATIDTTGFTNGTYKIRAKSEQKTGTLLSTNFSEYTMYGVGQTADTPLSPDLNRDGKVNLTDFSILLFWWGGDGGTSNPSADINHDGKVSLTDFSILLFNWTG